MGRAERGAGGVKGRRRHSKAQARQGKKQKGTNVLDPPQTTPTRLNHTPRMWQPPLQLYSIGPVGRDESYRRVQELDEVDRHVLRGPQQRTLRGWRGLVGSGARTCVSIRSRYWFTENGTFSRPPYRFRTIRVASSASSVYACARCSSRWAAVRPSLLGLFPPSAGAEKSRNSSMQNRRRGS